MTLEDAGEWARKWGPLIAIIGLIIGLIINAIRAFGWSWTVAGFVAIAFLGFILGYYVHFRSSPAPIGYPIMTGRGLWEGTFNVHRLNWPYQVEVNRSNPKNSKVVHIGRPHCPGCDTEATIEPDEDDPNIIRIYCPLRDVPNRRSCQTPSEWEGTYKKWEDLVRRLIEGDIKKGKIKPTIVEEKIEDRKVLVGVG